MYLLKKIYTKSLNNKKILIWLTIRTIPQVNCYHSFDLLASLVRISKRGWQQQASWWWNQTNGENKLENEGYLSINLLLNLVNGGRASWGSKITQKVYKRGTDNEIAVMGVPFSLLNPPLSGFYYRLSPLSRA
jgi:hypothetical protein